MLTAREAAGARHADAVRVVDAYEVQVATRKRRWAAATTAAATKHAAKEIAEALTQLDAAKRREREAWRAWHGVYV